MISSSQVRKVCRLDLKIRKRKFEGCEAKNTSIEVEIILLGPVYGPVRREFRKQYESMSKASVQRNSPGAFFIFMLAGELR